MSYNDKYPDMSAMYAAQFEYENKLKDKIKELEAELDRAHKELDDISGKHEKLLKHIAVRSNREQELRNKLDIAVDALKWILETYNLGMGYEAAIMEKCEFALEQITALEQKD